MPLNIRLSKNENHLLKHLGIHCIVNTDFGVGVGKYVAFLLTIPTMSYQCDIYIFLLQIDCLICLLDMSFSKVLQGSGLHFRRTGFPHKNIVCSIPRINIIKEPKCSSINQKIGLWFMFKTTCVINLQVLCMKKINFVFHTKSLFFPCTFIPCIKLYIHSPTTYMPSICQNKHLHYTFVDYCH